MTDESTTKTVVVEPDVHAAIKVLSALYDRPMQEIVNEAVRAQYDVEALANIDEEVLGEGRPSPAALETLPDEEGVEADANAE